MRTQLNFAERWHLNYKYYAIRRQQQTFRFLLQVSVVVLVLLAACSPWVWSYYVSLKITEVEKNIAVYSDVAATLNKIETLKQNIAAKEDFLVLVENNFKDPDKIQQDIRSLLPDGSLVSNYSLHADYSVQFTVTVDGPVDMSRMWVSLRDSGMFESVDFQSVLLTDQAQTLSMSLKLKQ